jgi:sialate O-acetylesterase
MRSIISNSRAVPLGRGVGFAAWTLVSLCGWAHVLGAPLPRGQNVIDTPAMSDGLCVSNLFQSHMVIQRDAPIRIWGWAAPGDTVTVTFDGAKRTATAAADRSWSVTFPALPAGDEPRTLVVADATNTLTFDDILLGDVWVCGGQSNMEFEMAKVDNGDLEIASAHFDSIRLLTLPQGVSQKAVANFGRHHHKGFWERCSPESVREFSGIGYTFARRLHMATRVPIGVIDISRGGTCVETWTPMEVLRAMDHDDIRQLLAEWDAKIAAWDPAQDLERRVAQFRERRREGKVPADAKEPTEPGPSPAVDVNRPGNCYGGQFGPLIGLAFKGVIWHQGYNNAFTDSTRCGEAYAATLTRMIQAWREATRQPDMAFGIIAQETEQEPQSLDNFLSGFTDNGCLIREAHFKVFDTLRRAGDKTIGFAAADDMRRSWYHPQIKIPVGERIARWALATQYGVTIRWLPPTITETNVDGPALVVKLDADVVPYNSGPIHGFAIAGSDRKWYPATAAYWTDEKKHVHRSVIVLTSPFVPEPVAYRYGWHRNPMGNLKIQSSELPVPIARSDTWTLNDLYEAYTGKTTASPTAMNRAERGELRRALEAADTRRRLEEAEVFVKEHRPATAE